MYSGYFFHVNQGEKQMSNQPQKPNQTQNTTNQKPQQQHDSHKTQHDGHTHPSKDQSSNQSSSRGRT